RQGYDGPVRVQPGLVPKAFVFPYRTVRHGIDQGMAHELYRNAMFFFVELLFEGKDYIEGIDVPLDIFDPSFPGGPNLGRDIIIGPISAGLGPFGDPEVEA